MCIMSYANNKGADQPAHPRSLISTFIVHCLDSVMSLVSVTKISSLMLASVAEQASLSLTWSETPEDTISHDEAHMLIQSNTNNILLWRGSHSNEYPQHYVLKENWRKLSFNYHQIPTLSVSVSQLNAHRAGA